MYLPKHFTAERAAAIKLMEDFPFATVISMDDLGQPFANHLPLLIECHEDDIKIIGHMAKRNPQWTQFKRNHRALVTFHGPHAYVSPKWYVSGRDVPTWNYAAVHASGAVKLIEAFDDLKEILAKQSARFERDRPDPWEFELPDDLVSPAALTSAIIGFEIQVESLEGKFKLSQNRAKGDREGVMRGLGGQMDEMSLLVRAMMENAGEAT